MRSSRNAQKAVASIVVMTFSFLCLFVAPVQAAMVGTADILQAQDEELARQKIELFIERSDVAHLLQSWGVTPDEAKARVATLTDEEVAMLANKIDQMPAGGNFIGFLAALALITVVVLVITDLMGVTDVFTFIKKR